MDKANQAKLTAVNSKLQQVTRESQELQRERALLLNLVYPRLTPQGNIIWVSAKEFFGEAK